MVVPNKPGSAFCFLRLFSGHIYSAFRLQFTTIEERITVVKQRRGRNDLNCSVIHKETKVSEMPVRITDNNVILYLFSQTQHVFFVLPLIHFRKRHIPVKVLVEPQIALTVMPDRIIP